MREVLRAYQNAVAGEITRYEGHVAKFMGDGVLGYLGWPRAHEDEAERAVRAGLAISSAVAKLAISTVTLIQGYGYGVLAVPSLTSSTLASDFVGPDKNSPKAVRFSKWSQNTLIETSRGTAMIAPTIPHNQLHNATKMKMATELSSSRRPRKIGVRI
jgi:hypothetical protein